jgi:uncharacterized protein
MSVPPVTIYMHLLAAYLLLAIPILGYLRFRNAQRRTDTGNSRAKVRTLRMLVVRQAVSICLLSGLWVFGGIPAPRLGLGAPPSWWLTGGLTVAATGFFVVSGIRLRAKAGKLREKLDQRAGVLLPNSMEERRWFAAVCIGGGVFEELAFRGFLFYYLSIVIPHINVLEKILVSALLFGMGHLYQGWKGIASTGAAGFIMGGLYILGGNLLLPVVAHIMGNMRVLLIFRPEKVSAPMPQGV